ncbi:MAG: carbamate kinase [Anaerosporomusa subterranea]|jgi:carbamate kinase|nr:carbamate kinase [Anaerosporomusa subterranea]
MPEQTLIVVAIGGNAITKENQKGTLDEMVKNIEIGLSGVVNLIASGNNVVLTHGNGPQVGNILLQVEAAKETIPPMPLDVCGAESQGQLGYLIQRSCLNGLKQRGVKRDVVTVLTHVMVDPRDSAFLHPTKPIGPFLTKEAAEIATAKKGFIFAEDSGRGYRRIVPSPKPISIIEKSAIEELAKAGKVVIACGGGGIPVIEGPTGDLEGVEAVIDKDFASAVLAEEIHADILVLVTGVDKVAINFGKPDVRYLDKMTVAEAQLYYDQGHFPPGSMGPKIAAAVAFVRSSDKTALITSLEQIQHGLEGGTVITP